MPKRPLHDPITFQGKRGTSENADNRRHSTGGAVPSAAASTGTTSTNANIRGDGDKNSKPRAAKSTSRRRSSGDRYQQHQQQSDSTTYMKQPPPPKQKQQHSTRRSSQILVKLSDACRDHEQQTHPGHVAGRSTLSENSNKQMDPSCQSALSNLSQLLPKLQREIPPCCDNKETPDPVEAAAILEDIVLLTDFYNASLMGCFCPHLPLLFKGGEDLKSVLDMVHYLMRHLLNPTLFPGSSDGDNRVEFASQNESIDKLCGCIARFLAFLKDDLSFRLGSSILTDCLETLEDCGVLMAAMRQQQTVFPCKLVLFGDTTGAAAPQTTRSAKHSQQPLAIPEYILELHCWEHVHTLQTVALRVLKEFLHQSSANRHADLPEQPVGQPQSIAKVLPSGTIDGVFPPDMVVHVRVMGTLLAGLRGVLLVGSTSCSRNAMVEAERKSAAMDILMHVVDDWTILGFSNIPMPCIIDMAVLVARSIKAHLIARASVAGEEQHSNYETKLAILLNGVLNCSSLEYDDGSVQQIQNNILPFLLDCIPNMKGRGESAAGTTLDSSTLEAIHSIIASNETAQAMAMNYCNAHGVLRFLFSLLVVTLPDPMDSGDTESTPGFDPVSVYSILVLTILLKAASPNTKAINLVDQDMQQLLKWNEGEASDKTAPQVHHEEATPTAPKRKRQTDRSPLQPLELAPTKKAKRSHVRKPDSIYLAHNPTIESSNETVIPGAWSRAFAHFVKAALDASKLLVGTSEQSALQNLSVVSACVCLVISLLSDDSFRTPGLLQIADTLCGKMLECCNKLAVALDSKRAAKFGDYTAANIVITCGLWIHFSKVTNVGGIYPPDVAFIYETLEVARVIGTKLLTSPHALSQQDPLVLDLFSSQQFLSHDDTCLASVLSLPLVMKGGVLVTLATSHRRKHARSEMMQLLRETFVTHRDSAQRIHGDSIFVAATFLLLLPMFFSIALQDPDCFSSNDDVAALVRDIMHATGRSIDEECDPLLKHFLFASRWIQGILLKEAEVSVFDASSVLSFLSIRHTSSKECSYAKLDDKQWSSLRDLDEAILHLPTQVMSYSAAPDTRYLLAMVLVDCCMCHTPQQLRKKLRENDDSTTANDTLSWVLSIPFVDTCSRVRNLTSIAITSLLTAHDGAFVIARYCSDEAFRAYPFDIGSTKLKSVAQGAASGLFHEIDGLLKRCGFSDSQLSLTIGENSNPTSRGGKVAAIQRMATQKSAIFVLSMLNRKASLGNSVGTSLCEKSLLRVMRMWATPCHCGTEDCSTTVSLDTASSNAIAFGPLAFLPDSKAVFTHLMRKQSWTTLGVILFADAILLNMKQSPYDILSTVLSMIQTAFTESQETVSSTVAWSTDYEVLAEKLPLIAAQFVIEDDEAGLNLVVGCHRLLKEKMASGSSACLRRGKVVGDSVGRSFVDLCFLTLDKKKSQKLTKDFCLEKMDQILPPVLLSSEATSLKCLSRLCGLGLGRIIKSRELMILKRLVWELGCDFHDSFKTANALKAAALARADVNMMASMSKDRQLGTTAAKDWITEHFMYLFVNTVQLQWQSRPSLEQIQALRCLAVLFDFLRPEKASQYFPQILASLNQAITDGFSSLGSDHDSMVLGLQAVTSLAKFVRLAATGSLETVIDNLTGIVVALIPCLDEKENEIHALAESKAEAVSLLEFLATDATIRRFPKAFAKIPFLPSSRALANVHKSLRDNGINFDTIFVLSTLTSDSQSIGDDQDSLTASTRTSAKAGDKVLALRKRLDVISSLLENENANVKNVVLKHLTALLRSNRGLFHELVHSEGSASPRDFLTLLGKGGREHGIITDIIEKLVRRCAIETNEQVRIQLAQCLGEIGAISESHLEDMSLYRSKADDTISTMHRWRLKLPPWQTNSQKYELQIVTKYLVLALKSSSSSEEQIKIGYAIQQLLVLLDSASPDSEANPTVSAGQKKMSPWLYDQLCKAKVYESIEPFWSSQFNEKQRPEQHYRSRQPPFFPIVPDYFSWLANFSRWMIASAHGCRRSHWKGLFYACRSAVRSFAGVDLAEFLLPLLVADRISHGNDKEFEQIRDEFVRVLDFESAESQPVMPLNERRKAVSVFFSTLDTLAFWEEKDNEDEANKYKGTGRSNKRKSPQKAAFSGSSWPFDVTKTQIRKLREDMPLLLLAKAASSVGMHARALKLAELVARKAVVPDYFEPEEDVKVLKEWNGSILQRPILSALPTALMKKILANLNDCETMRSLGKDLSLSSSLVAADDIRTYEAEGNYKGALQSYELALQVKGSMAWDDDMALESGELGCLLELGKFENVLSKVESQLMKGIDQTKSFATEAAWRLGKWDTLSNLVDSPPTQEPTGGSNGVFRWSLGKAMSSLHNSKFQTAKSALHDAQESVMGSLSTVARESYSKSYGYLVRLHQIREVEDSLDYFSLNQQVTKLHLKDIADSADPLAWSWDGRLRLTTPNAASAIIQTRLAVARLAKNGLQESSLLLQMGRHARKNGIPSVSESFLCNAEAKLTNLSRVEGQDIQNLGSLVEEVRTQYAKLKKQSGQNLVALKILEHDSTELTFKEMAQITKRERDSTLKIKRIAVSHEVGRMSELFGEESRASQNDDVLAERYARRLLRLTQWTVDSGMQDGAVLDRFETVIKLSPKWEKARFALATYLNKVVSRTFEKESSSEADDDVMRFNVLYRDRACQNFIVMAMKNYTQCLNLDTKHVYQALPRLLSLWFDFVSVRKPAEGTFNDKRMETLRESQSEARTFMAKNIKEIPAAAFYTALSQLVSNLFHQDKDTILVVKKILGRVLYKFPEQSMWHLAWLTGSKDKKRASAGKDIFQEAQTVLARTKHHDMVALLQDAGSLFQFFRELARRDDRNSSSTMTVKPFRGTVPLECYVPPVQAALSITPFKSSDTGSKEYFPRLIPRMRAFSTKVSVMSSKAKPKKLVAFAVPGTWKSAKVKRTHSSGSSIDKDDIGQFHFLVKQEAKGDLRKDARVQDLNNVVNRLIDSSVNSTSSLASRSRRLRLRTFAVTCLSEDTGVLEWVPNTDCFRNLITKSYNPQTSQYCHWRQGRRLTDFGSSNLRRTFDEAQNTFFKKGNLTKAANEFGEVCRKHPPLFSWWFVQSFSIDAHAWYEARLRFTLSAAAWSAVGHVVGLGDRHSENILVETTTGRLLHVDFDCIFDKALNLPRPEIVPFRLTANMIDGFGPTGSDGMFKRGMESSFEVLRGNSDTLLSVLEPFIKDPVIDWRKHRSSQQSSPRRSSRESSFHRAKRSISVIEERLSGVCILRNPNYRKHKEVIKDRGSHNDDDVVTELLPLSVEGQVQKLCTEASKKENLVQVYAGWMPWL